MSSSYAPFPRYQFTDGNDKVTRGLSDWETKLAPYLPVPLSPHHHRLPSSPQAAVGSERILPSKTGQFAKFDRQNHRLSANLTFPSVSPTILLSRNERFIAEKLAILPAKFLSANLLPLLPLSQVSGCSHLSLHFCLRQEARSIKRQPPLNFLQRKGGNIATILVVADGHFWCPRKRHPQSKRYCRWANQAYVHLLEAT